jgi:hypothetical protein
VEESYFNGNKMRPKVVGNCCVQTKMNKQCIAMGMKFWHDVEAELPSLGCGCSHSQYHSIQLLNLYREGIKINKKFMNKTTNKMAGNEDLNCTQKLF